MTVIEEIVQKLQRELETQDIELSDFSAMHEGHAGLSALTSNLHLKGRIKSSKFKGVSRVNRERLVYAILKDEIASNTIHALTLVLEEA